MIEDLSNLYLGEQKEMYQIFIFLELLFQDSRKTSGANTPNKEGANTPTTKSYRGQ